MAKARAYGMDQGPIKRLLPVSVAASQLPEQATSTDLKDAAPLVESKNIDFSKVTELLLDPNYPSPEKLLKDYPGGIKNLVLLIGYTGAGKSTLTNVLLGHHVYEESEEKVATEEQTVMRVKKINPTVPHAIMGNLGSCTEYPTLYPSNDFVLCDCPGFAHDGSYAQEHRLMQTLALQTLLHTGQYNSKKESKESVANQPGIKGLIVVIEWPALTGQRANGFNQILSWVRAILGDQWLAYAHNPTESTINNSIFFVITKILKAEADYSDMSLEKYVADQLQTQIKTKKKQLFGEKKWVIQPMLSKHAPLKKNVLYVEKDEEGLLRYSVLDAHENRQDGRLTQEDLSTVIQQPEDLARLSYICSQKPIRMESLEEFLPAILTITSERNHASEQLEAEEWEKLRQDAENTENGYQRWQYQRDYDDMLRMNQKAYYAMVQILLKKETRSEEEEAQLKQYQVDSQRLLEEITLIDYLLQCTKLKNQNRLLHFFLMEDLAEENVTHQRDFSGALCESITYSFGIPRKVLDIYRRCYTDERRAILTHTEIFFRNFFTEFSQNVSEKTSLERQLARQMGPQFQLLSTIKERFEQYQVQKDEKDISGIREFFQRTIERITVEINSIGIKQKQQDEDLVFCSDPTSFSLLKDGFLESLNVSSSSLDKLSPQNEYNEYSILLSKRPDKEHVITVKTTAHTLESRNCQCRKCTLSGSEKIYHKKLSTVTSEKCFSTLEERRQIDPWDGYLTGIFQRNFENNLYFWDIVIEFEKPRRAFSNYQRTYQYFLISQQRINTELNSLSKDDPFVKELNAELAALDEYLSDRGFFSILVKTDHFEGHLPLMTNFENAAISTLAGSYVFLLMLPILPLALGTAALTAAVMPFYCGAMLCGESYFEKGRMLGPYNLPFINNYYSLYTSLLPIDQLQKDVLYVEKKGEKRAGLLNYVVLDPDGQPQLGSITIQEIENSIGDSDVRDLYHLLQEETIDLKKLEEVLPGILKITSKRGHTLDALQCSLHPSNFSWGQKWNPEKKELSFSIGERKKISIKKWFTGETGVEISINRSNLPVMRDIEKSTRREQFVLEEQYEASYQSLLELKKCFNFLNKEDTAGLVCSLQIISKQLKI